MSTKVPDPAAAIRRIGRLGFPWQTQDPFLFCVHHDDHYPAGNEALGPKASLAGRSLGQDFVIKDGWRMYHGETVPGFPQHPHRGFETVTVVRKGLVDHSDSMGAAGRYGRGDTQWMTAGSGVLHSEMFPLLDPERPNHLELFQIWLNLPARNKMVEPYFKMIWADQAPHREIKDEAGRVTHVGIVAGSYGDATPPAPPPDSWAAQPDSDVAIWTIKMEPHAQWVLPPARTGTNRTLYVFSGSGLHIGSKEIPAERLVELQPDVALPLRSDQQTIEMLLLQGRPIGEPVVQHGPFVMNSREEIVQAYQDYQRTRFGGWPWSRNDQVHGPDEERFARHADGREERPA
jgi:redox-sensitive bicupin YhaK (pirin superfamily)